MKQTGQILILDMYSIAWKFYHVKAYQRLTDEHDQPTGMIYGTLKGILDLKNRFPQAIRILCVYDAGFSGRDKQYPPYKQNRVRGESNESVSFSVQMATIMGFLEYVGYHKLKQIGIEADDIIAIYSLRWAENSKNNKAVIVSTDSDFYQLLYPNTQIAFYNHKTKVFYDADNIQEVINVPVRYYAVYKAMIGDSADNIPRCFSNKEAQNIIQNFRLYHDELKHDKKFRTNFDLVRLPYKYMEPLRQGVNFRYIEYNVNDAQQTLDSLNIRSFRAEEFLLEV